MKKTYIIPALLVVTVATEGRLLDGSLQISNNSGETDAFVKEQSTAGASHYSVWDDDWSN